MSLPYPEPGIRLIRQDQIETFNTQIDSLKAELDEAVRQLDQHFADMKSAARERLGSLYNPADYPPSLLGLFSVAHDFPSVPADRPRRGAADAAGQPGSAAACGDTADAGRERARYAAGGPSQAQHPPPAQVRAVAMKLSSPARGELEVLASRR